MTELTLEDWATAGVKPHQLTQEQVDHVMELFKPVQEWLQNNLVPGTFQFLPSIKPDGGSQIFGVTIFAGMERMTSELLAMRMLGEGGLQALIDNLDDLVDQANARYENLKPRILVP